MDDHSNYAANQKRIWESLENRDYTAAAEAINSIIGFLENNNATEYIDYIEYLFLLHQVYSETRDLGSAIAVLGKLLNHFQNSVDPRVLNPRCMELYIKTWTYLGYLLSESGQLDESINVFQKCLPLLVLLRGLESQEVETVKWYIKSVQSEGKISTDEPPDIFIQEEDLEGLRCSFCQTGQMDIIAGPSVYICKNCVQLYHSFLPDENYCKHLKLACSNKVCAFQCGTAPEDMPSIFPGPGVFVCGTCVDGFMAPEHWS